MKVFRDNRIQFFTLLSAVFILSGCVSSTPGVQSSSRTATRSAPKPYILSKSGDVSPLEQHMMARKMVDPSDTSATHRYTYLAEDYQKRIAGKPQSKPKGLSDAVVPPRKPDMRLASAIPALKPAPKAGVKPQAKPVQKVKPVKTAKIAVKKPVSKPVRAQGASVTAVRVGKHPDKTRIVLDLSAKPTFDFQMDDRKNVLVVTLSNASWSTEAKRVFSSHPLLLAYLAKPTRDGGTYLAIKMKKKAKLIFKSVFPPASGKGYRIVLDVAPA